MVFICSSYQALYIFFNVSEMTLRDAINLFGEHFVKRYHMFYLLFLCSVNGSDFIFTLLILYGTGTYFTCKSYFYFVL